MASFQTQPTPNPDSLKFTTDAGPFINSGMESFNSAEEAGGHALGKRLFRLTGVANVFILPQFVTITKDPTTNWDVLLPMVVDALRKHFESR